METGVLIGFFAKRDEARGALRELQRRGYHRTALVSKTKDGSIHVWHPFLWRRVLGAIFAAILVGGFVGMAYRVFYWSESILCGSISVLIPILISSMIGAFFGGAWIQRSKYGVERTIIVGQSRTLVSEETALILQAPIKTLRFPVAILRECGEISPAIFVLHPKHESSIKGLRKTGVPLSLAQIQEHAQHLAIDHQIELKPKRNTELLTRLENARQWVHQVCSDLSETSRLEKSIPPIAEWLLDNEYIIEGNVRDVQLNLPRRFYQELPVLVNEPARGLPRIFGIAQELVSKIDLGLDQENILAFIEAYQVKSILSIGELWAVPQMLRIALIESIQDLATSASTEMRERELADFWANRLITVNRQDPTQLFAIMAELAKAHTNPSPYFASQLVDHLYDEEAALVPIQSWLERTYPKPLTELNLREQNRQTRDQISIGNAFTSLRQLAQLDWRQIFERLSRVEQLLRLDPAGVYSKMDFKTRDRYRRVIEELARGSGQTEDQVAQSTIELTARASPETMDDERRIHIGTYLIGEGRSELARLIGCRETLRFRFLEWIYRHHSAVYFFGIGFISSVLLSLIILLGLRVHAPAIQFLIIILLLIPTSQLALEILNYLVIRFLPPRTLPRMDFEGSSIPDTFRTLVVVPELLVDVETIRAEVEKLEIHYLANKESNLLFSLFTDYTDSDQAHRDDDESLLQAVTEGIEALNHRYGSGRFFLFHRERAWSESEQKFIGWERKRGKLEELNRLIAGTRSKDAVRLVYVGDPHQLSNVRFVITLDSDTQLPLGTARKMIETLAHPLNQPRFDAEGNILAGSYTIIQPRVSPSLPSTSASPFSRLFAEAVGIDPYTKAVSDVNQDLTGEGSYHGKGIYDVRAFGRVLSGRFPEEWLLSHDLIEGAHVRVGLASDIELIDEFPQDYLSYISRQHRWIRGDWQIADWIWPRVPLADRKLGPNQLSLYNRWKVLDNLRRSLVPVTCLGLLVASWLSSSQIGWISTLVVAVQLLFQPLAQPFTWATTHQGLKNFSSSKVAHDLLLAVTDAALLPHQAGLALDAILRVWYSRLISHRGFLKWTTAQAMPGSAQAELPLFVISIGLASIFSGIVGWTLLRWMPTSLLIASPWLVLWFLSPLIVWLLNLRPHVKQKQLLLPEKDLRFLRQVARRTWRYFSDFVNEDSSWLPPDNYQVDHKNQLAMRTSPTNIGLWLLSALAAHDFGYLSVDQVVEKLTHTMETINKLERYEGHLLNWYDIQTLAPLERRYVSAVDSGNLLGALWTLEHGLDELIQEPVLDVKTFEGLRDTLEILKQIVQQESIPGFDTHALDELMFAWESPPDHIADMIQLLRRVEGSVKTLAEKAHETTGMEAHAVYWITQMERQVSAWLYIVDRYLTWIEILDEKTEEEITALGPEVVDLIRQALDHAPSLHDLAHGHIGCIQALQSMGEVAPATASPLFVWLDRLMQAFSMSKWLAGEMLGLGERLVKNVNGLSNSINMRFLYDPERRLFSIGYNVSDGCLDGAYYDLLASEARFGSFVAIARGDIPVEHWFSMSRPYNAIGRRRVLLSWTGTMFEYLMPLIFQHSYEHSLLDKAARDAVAIHIDYGRKRHVPWGLSESAFGDLDFNKTYQYKAFGVPELGLKRGLKEEVVVSPYATLLAVNIAPRQAVKNLRRLESLALLNDYGFYEAMDFNRQSDREGEIGVIVRAYMAHHQGMGFLSLTNFFHGNPIQRRFHADVRVRTVEPLLHERIPSLPPLHHISTRERMPSVESVGEIAPSVSKFDTPNTSTPKVQLLGNGHYSLMITNAGGGYSQWGDFEITRWRSDRTRDPWGTFCYIQEADSDRLWSNTYQPICGGFTEYSVHFALERAVFHRTDNSIQTQTEIVVSKEDDVEIRRVTLTNRSITTRRINLTSYIELSMALHKADRQHPAFNKLFIQTEALPDYQAVLAYRRPRMENEPPIYVAHRITLEQANDGAMQFETDRHRFIGRGRTLSNPAGIFQGLSNSQGFVLDPILSLRKDVTLNPGQRVQVSLVLAAGETRDQVIKLMIKYSDPRAIDRAMDFAWASAQLELRLLRIQPDEAHRFQKFASHLLFPNPLLRPPAERLAENSKGQAGLWPYGISGDLPIILITISEQRDIILVRQMLQAHTYLRRHGLIFDLVILNEEAGGYEQPLREQLENVIQAHLTYTGVDQPGGIFLRSAAQIPQEDLTLLMATASVVLVAARGPMPQQLGLLVEFPDLPETLSRKHVPREPSAMLPFMELPYFNSLGGFTPDGREYVIYLGPNTHTPAPWVNVIANPTFGTLVSEAGSGFTWYGNSQRNRLTEWSNDPVLDPPSEVLYIRDEESGVYWTPTPSPIREEVAYRARHGAGYTVFEHNSQGIEQELTVFVPVDENGGESIKLQRLRLKNDSTRYRKLSVTYYVEWTLGETRETSQMHVVTHWDGDIQALIAQNRYHPEYGDYAAFAAINPPAESYSGDRTSFIGRNRSLSNPAGMERIIRSGRVGAGLDPCAAQQVFLEFAPGETVEISCMLGQAESLDAVHKLVLSYRQELALETALNQTIAWWDNYLGTIEVQTPELAANFLINRWLLYQALSCRIWGRSAFYQSGGAFGFRDQLQDVMALLYAHPELARQHILLAASRQFLEGDVQHWWHPPGGAGIRSRISDDFLWLPYTVAHYIRITGDVNILHTQIPFLSTPPLEDDQKEIFNTPEVSPERATLFEHCRRAVMRGLTVGPNGLPLMGTGDWNDGMNLVGASGIGESVWLAWFLVDVLQGMKEMSDLLDKPDLSQTYERDRRALIQRIERAAWDGKWYLRAIFDDGTLIGSSTSKEASIDSLPQSWACLTGAAEVKRAGKALESAWQHLVHEDEGLVLLFAPPFDKSQPSPGYIMGYPPGVRENGGQYTHAALWLAMALARQGDGERAAKILRMLNPIERTVDPETVWRYGVEPYVVAADVYHLTGRIGKGGWSWYTGSAAWMYRAWVEEILGLKLRGDRMQIDPVIPTWWGGFRLRYRHGEAVYEIQVENPEGCQRGVAWVEMDGQRMQDKVIPLERSLVKHRILVHMAFPARPNKVPKIAPGDS
jgi:cyclic beta-1,2-glucan synthetase